MHQLGYSHILEAGLDLRGDHGARSFLSATTFFPRRRRRIGRFPHPRQRSPRCANDHEPKALSSASMSAKPPRSATDATRSLPRAWLSGIELVDDHVEHRARCERQPEREEASAPRRPRTRRGGRGLDGTGRRGDQAASRVDGPARERAAPRRRNPPGCSGSRSRGRSARRGRAAGGERDAHRHPLGDVVDRERREEQPPAAPRSSRCGPRSAKRACTCGTSVEREQDEPAEGEAGEHLCRLPCSRAGTSRLKAVAASITPR